MRLEDFMKENQEKFDDKEPSTGHLERFESKLRNNRSWKSRSGIIWLVAAVLTGVIIAGGLFFNYSGQQSKECQLSAEVANLKNHYESVMDNEIKNLQVILKDTDPATRNKVMNDALQMKEDTKDLPSDFCDGSNNKKAVAVIVQHYEAKIKALQTMTSFLEENKRQIS